MKVPFIDLKRFEDGFLEAVNAKLSSMVMEAQFIGGPEVSRLEERLQDALDVRHAVTCANGTDAIQLALRALGVGRGDVVLTPNVTFWATFEAVVNVGADAVTIDVDALDGGVSLSAMAEAIDAIKPKAAVIAHLYGWGTRRLAEVRALCRDRSVLLVEDGAQCYGTSFNERSIYEGALISTTSFYPAKVLGGAGDGGAVFTNDDDLAERVRRLGNHGRSAHYGHSDVGWNSRLDAPQAAYLNICLDHVAARIESRRRSALFYQQILPELGIDVMHPPEAFGENGYCNVCMVADTSKRTQLMAALKSEGIGFGVIYPGVMSAQVGAKGFHKGHFGSDAGEKFCSSVLNLPLFPYMREAELERVVEVIGQAVGR